MSYIKILWKEADEGLPSLYYSELDDNRWELRKVEVYRDGLATYADKDISTGSTMLGLIPFPPISELGARPELDVEEISKEEFDEAWSKVVSSSTFK